MNAVTIHKDHLEILRDYTDEELGLLLRALMMDVFGEPAIELPAELTVIRKYIHNQNTRFSKQQSNKRTGKGSEPNEPKEPTPPNEPNEPTQPSVPETVSDTVTNSNTISDTEGITPPNPPQAGGKRGGGKKKPKADEKPVPKVQCAEFVSMTNDEKSSLIAKLGEHGTARCIEILDNYKGSKGKKYDSDYRAILSWVIKRYEEENGQNPVPPPINPGSRPSKNPFVNAVMNDNGEG
jgi:hypothetical protein